MSTATLPGSPIDPQLPRVECFLLCDYAKSENNKLYIVGGAWNRIEPSELPLIHSAYLAVKLIIPLELTLKGAEVRIELLDRNGNQLGRPAAVYSMQSDTKDTEEHSHARDVKNLITTVLIAEELTMEIIEPGRYILRLVLNDQEYASTSFFVTRPKQQPDDDSFGFSISSS